MKAWMVWVALLVLTMPVALPPSHGQAPVSRPAHPRGARPSPRWKAFVTPQHRARLDIPASFGVVIPQLSCWGNCTYGDCVSAEECFAKASYALTQGAPELFIPENTIVAWASSHGFLNGANLTDVMDAMAADGISVNGVMYKDGPYQSVNFADYATLCSAIYAGPVKLGIAAGQLESVVNSTNDQSGWWAVGLSSDQNEDHSIPALGYGTAAQLAALLNVQVPSGLAPTTPCIKQEIGRAHV